MGLLGLVPRALFYSMQISSILAQQEQSTIVNKFNKCWWIHPNVRVNIAVTKVQHEIWFEFFTCFSMVIYLLGPIDPVLLLCSSNLRQYLSNYFKDQISKVKEYNLIYSLYYISFIYFHLILHIYS